MNLHLRDKFELIDLATRGSRARQIVKPDVYVAVAKNKPFREGDLLDANGTLNLISEILYGKTARGVAYYNTLEEFQTALDNYEITDTTIYFILDESLMYADGQYAKLGGLSQEIIDYITQEISKETDRAIAVEDELRDKIGDGYENTIEKIEVVQKDLNSLRNEIDIIKGNIDQGDGDGDDDGNGGNNEGGGNNTGGTTNIIYGNHKTIILTAAQYGQLVRYDKNAIYFIVDSIDNEWTFGNRFPITFKGNSRLGDEFPIILN